MFFKLALFVAMAAMVVGQADKYPAGLSPALCPNYPHCDNALIALYNNPGHAVPYAAVSAHNYPAGVSPAACPNYPYCGVYGAPVGYYAREYPAGVSPAACPNYPYC